MVPRPYCYSEIDWQQSASDIGSVLGSQVEDLLPADELVVHIRSGDNILAIMDWTKRDATSNSFVENSIAGAPIQPGCDYYLDAALRGNDGGPFAKVHVMVDLWTFTSTTRHMATSSQIPDLVRAPTRAW